MTNKQYFDQLTAYADAQSITANQAANSSKAQFAAALGLAVDDPIWSGSNEGRFTGLRRLLVRYLRDKERQAKLKTLVDRLKAGNATWIETNFPDAVLKTDVDPDTDKPIIIIYLEGE